MVLSHNTQVTVNVQDFTIVASPSSIPVQQCASNNMVIITITSLGGFSGIVTLTPSAPTGLTAIVNPTTITMSGSATLTVTAGCTTPISPPNYLVDVTGSSGTLSHKATVTVMVTQKGPAATPPVISQATWNHRFSLARYNNVQTWKLGMQNIDNTTTIYASMRIDAIDGQGTSPFTLVSQVFTLTPLQNLNHIFLTQTFSTSQINETWTFTVSIQWGTTATADPAQLPFNSIDTINGAPNSGSFTVLP
jgi:hypothetical protein